MIYLCTEHWAKARKEIVADSSWIERIIAFLSPSAVDNAMRRSDLHQVWNGDPHRVCEECDTDRIRRLCL